MNDGAPTYTIAGLLGRVAELETALRPFAAASAAFAVRPGGLRLLSTATGDVTVGDLRRDAQALADGSL